MIEQLKGRLIVSCQAWIDTPFYGPHYMRAMAESAQMAGAGGIRANSPEDIREIKKTVKLPMIGIHKLPDKRGFKIITPDFESARSLVEAGSDIIAIDATNQGRPDVSELERLIQEIKTKLKVPVMADISNEEEAIRAERFGADLVGTTMSGYTSYTEKTDGPNLALIETLKRTVRVPIVGEGRFSQPHEVKEALNQGAHCVVIGTAITAPWEIAARFVRAIQ
ncbi:Putative N-acetylmannosamine-6-phosphate 2-epimerase [Paenibacillus allorhizoplanae]|uniref:Putative N-acetylmannosamine-6-phosphate 2-epimerase n=1 Tax=Paenibacillus allorhizoplanae TaxID=2905648 RepID=A0ABM9CL94_9BACL|nr:N-acetylmannosamine-6-phosphate 2-epimerase [Paenibacillus allorhizoplanae]CAH1217640.1 Putative N-acetylmannosamine-6-phosphate 2-epimerase [Paenibacillus allorhizoplanae]